MYKIWVDKKGVGIDDFIPLLLTIFFFIFFLGFLVIVSTNQNSETRTNAYEVQEKIVSQDILANYIKMKRPDASDNLDFIIAAAHQNQLYSLQGTFDPYFNPIYPTVKFNTWYITISAGDRPFRTAGDKRLIEKRNELWGLPLADIYAPLADDRLISIHLEKVGGRGLAPGPLEMP